MENFTRILLQVIQWQRRRRVEVGYGNVDDDGNNGGTTRSKKANNKVWILKTPQTIETLEYRDQAFASEKPRYILTHRDSVGAFKSGLVMLAYLFTSHQEFPKDPEAFARWMVERNKWVAQRMLPRNLAKTLPDFETRVLNVDFRNYMKDPVEIAMECSKFAGLRADDEGELEILKEDKQTIYMY